MGKRQLNPASLELEIFCRGLISEIQTVFKNKQSIELVYQGEEKQKFNLDRKLLHHILINLLSNACKYSPKNRIINFEVRCQVSDIVFVIRDRGIGIPARDLPKLFDSFYRARNVEGFQGTGLG